MSLTRRFFPLPPAIPWIWSLPPKHVWITTNSSGLAWHQCYTSISDWGAQLMATKHYNFSDFSWGVNFVVVKKTSNRWKSDILNIFLATPGFAWRSSGHRMEMSFAMWKIDGKVRAKGRSTVSRVEGLNVNFNAFKGPCFLTAGNLCNTGAGCSYRGWQTFLVEMSMAEIQSICENSCKLVKMPDWLGNKFVRHTD